MSQETEENFTALSNLIAKKEIIVECNQATLIMFGIKKNKNGGEKIG